MQECREHRLFELAEFQRRTFRLNLARLLKLALENRRPFLLPTLVFLRRRRGRQLARGLGDSALARLGKKAACRDQGTFVPSLRLAQRQREGPQHAARALEAFQLSPLGVEKLDQLGMEGIAVDEPLLRGLAILAGLIVQLRDALER